jgi:hypothetical protein
LMLNENKSLNLKIKLNLYSIPRDRTASKALKSMRR